MSNFTKQMEMMLYHSDEGDVSVNAYIINESLWITQKTMAELFGVGISAWCYSRKNSEIRIVIKKLNN